MEVQNWSVYFVIWELFDVMEMILYMYITYFVFYQSNKLFCGCIDMNKWVDERRKSQLFPTSNILPLAHLTHPLKVLDNMKQRFLIPFPYLIYIGEGKLHAPTLQCHFEENISIKGSNGHLHYVTYLYTSILCIWHIKLTWLRWGRK